MHNLVTSGSSALRLMGEVRYGDPASFGGLTLVPLFSNHPAPFDYLLLLPAIAAGTAVIQEIGGGTVPALRIVNKGDLPVLLIDGEHLVGVKQNRILNTTILVPEKSSLDIPVSCVEQGRWGAPRGTARPTSPHLFMTARARKAEAVTASVRSTGMYASDQGAIWRDVGITLFKLGASSSTSAMEAIYEQRGTDIGAYLKHLPWQADQTGVVVAVSGRIVCCDLFDRPETLECLWGRLVSSYAVEAIGQAQGRITSEAAKAFLWEASQSTITAHSAVGRGTDMRLTSRGIVGAALEAESTIIHLALFKRDQGVQSHSGADFGSVRQRRGSKEPDQYS